MGHIPRLTRPIAEKYFRAVDKIDVKSDQSPVTIADTLIEKKIREILENEFSATTIFGEEFGGSLALETGWCIDPIDGTRAFIAGKPTFGTLIAFCDNGIPLVGLIDMPCLDEMYIGYYDDSQKMSQVTLNGNMIKASGKQNLSDAFIATSSPAAFTAIGLQKFNKIAQKCRDVYYGGDCHNYALLASGHIDIVMEHTLSPYDMMALIPILRASGAIVTDWSGAPIKTQNSGEILAASSAELHSSALALL